MATKFEYSAEELQSIIKAYQSGDTLELLASKYNKSVASIRMKLVKQGVYKAQAKAGSTKSKKQEAQESEEIITKALKLYGEPLF